MKKLKSAVSICMGILFCLMLLNGEVAFAEPKEVTFDHTYPATMKVGEVFPEEYYVNIYGLDPNEENGEGLVDYIDTYATAECGGWCGQADANGNILRLSNTEAMTYKPGEVSIELTLIREKYNSVEDYKIATIMVEEPVITHNAPSKVKVGDVIEFTTAITNTAYENKKVSDYEEPRLSYRAFYMPSVEVIEGKNLVTQASQDYSNTLNTSEQLSFTGSGTVKLKISYSPMTYEFRDEDGDLEPMSLNGVMEKIVTIVVEDDKPAVTVPDTSTENKPSDTTKPEDVTTQEPETEKPSTEVEDTQSEDVTTEDTTKEDAYVVQINDDKQVVTKDDFSNILKENKDKDVVIKSNHDIEFTFEKGSMSEVENMENYDFRTALEQKFEEKSEYGKKVNEGNFVIRINYNYSGKLPGEASIKIHVGIENKGITLYYSKLCDDGKILLVYSGVVDDDGYITVKQDSCSDYILTTERVDDEAEQDSVSKPADKDGGIGVVILVIAIIAVIVAALTTTFIIMKKRRA